MISGTLLRRALGVEGERGGYVCRQMVANRSPLLDGRDIVTLPERGTGACELGIGACLCWVSLAAVMLMKENIKLGLAYSSQV